MKREKLYNNGFPVWKNANKTIVDIAPSRFSYKMKTYAEETGQLQMINYFFCALSKTISFRKAIRVQQKFNNFFCHRSHQKVLPLRREFLVATRHQINSSTAVLLSLGKIGERRRLAVQIDFAIFSTKNSSRKLLLI